ncbi:antibiotic biosynthesis monooxygenase family protein [Pendulispora albinea]|uniref:Antibiotic biosynthesis monooxygenase n=1 Tax=Pendulispora albinea TaxID=2741071 RepID=A0ABZ2LY63_9BACT
MATSFLGMGCASDPPPAATTPSTSASSGNTSITKAMVARVWHGRTPGAKSEEYTRYLDENGVRKILGIPNNRGCQMLRRIDGDNNAEFFVVSYWDNREDIKKFAGDDIEKTHNLPRDPEFLIELEPKVRHFDLIVDQLPKGQPRIARMWHGRTPAAKAEEYTRYTKEQGLAKIQSIEGNRGVQLFRRPDGETTEYMVVSYWDSRDDIKKYAGADIEKVHSLPRDPEFLIELEPKVRNLDLVVHERRASMP